MHKEGPLDNGNNLRQSELGKKSPTSFTVPKYADRFKDIMMKAETTPKVQPAPPTITPKKAEQEFFFLRVKSIGVGAHSFVYLVQQQTSKMLLSQKSITKQHAAEIKPDLLRQIKLLSFLQHNNIIKLYHVYCSQTHINLVMEYAQDSLFNLKQKFVVFKEKEIIEVIKQLLLALRHIHRKGIVHADIKLQNIMIANGTIKLVDFGLAHRVREKEMKKEVQGTMEYLPPQYAAGEDSGTHRDVWAIGMLAYQMATGKHPFDGLKENQKWAKLVKSPPEVYTKELQQQLKSMGIQSQKVMQLVRGIFQGCENRWSAQQLLQLPFFSPL